MKLSARELVVLMGTSLLAIGGIVFGSYDPLWQLLRTPETYREGMTMALSVVVVLLGYVLGAAVREATHLHEISQLLESFGRTLDTSLSGVSGLAVFQTSDSALDYIVSRLPYAQKVWNTRVPAPGFGEYSGAASKRYETALKKAIGSGQVYFRDVVGEVFASQAQALSQPRRSGHPPNYIFARWAHPNSPFVNFTVIQDHMGIREVVFGWVITPGGAFEQNCFMSRHHALVDHFVAVHDYMMTVQFTPSQAGPLDPTST